MPSDEVAEPLRDAVALRAVPGRPAHVVDATPWGKDLLMPLSAACLAALLVGTAATTEVRITFTESRGDLGTCSPGAACDGDTCCKHGVSLSEVRLFSDATNLPIESITNPSGYNPIGEVPSKLIDGLTTGSKWLDIKLSHVRLLGADSCRGRLAWRTHQSRAHCRQHSR